MSVSESVHEKTRKCVNYTPNIWGNMFLPYASKSHHKEVDTETMQHHEELKEKLKMFISSNKDLSLSQKLNFIGWIQRLGVFYHFEHEIEQALANIYNTYTSNNNLIMPDDDEDLNNLHSLALLFRLLRQHGYPISSDIFERFIKDKDMKGKFDNENLAHDDDMEGMLALYEASQLEAHGENILEEALNFSHTHLKSLIDNNKLSSDVKARVKHCLSKPLHKRLCRIEARPYISFYQQLQDHSSRHHKMLLNFAKLDFNILQHLHQRELGNVTKWWKELDLPRKVPYGRDRLVESYFWVVSMFYEPQFSTGRIVATKLIAILVFLDDTYDVYGTLEELQLFTQAIRRWDISPIESLPECMKAEFEAVLQVCNEIEMMTEKEGTSNFVMLQVKQAFVKLCEAYLKEAKWCNEKYIPRYDEEYKENAHVSVTSPLEIVSFLGLFGNNNLASKKEVFDWISTNPKMVRDASLIGRLIDDLATYKFEQERDHVASGVECCMKQFGVSEEEAHKIIKEDIKNCWKEINEECLKNPNKVPKWVLNCVVNMGRVFEVVYENRANGFNTNDSFKHHIVQLLLDPITIEP